MPVGNDREFRFEVKFLGAREGREAADLVAKSLDGLHLSGQKALETLTALNAAMRGLSGNGGLAGAQAAVTTATTRTIAETEKLARVSSGASATRMKQWRAERDALLESIRLHETLAQAQSRVRIARAGVAGTAFSAVRSEIETARGQFAPATWGGHQALQAREAMRMANQPFGWNDPAARRYVSDDPYQGHGWNRGAAGGEAPYSRGYAGFSGSADRFAGARGQAAMDAERLARAEANAERAIRNRLSTQEREIRLLEQVRAGRISAAQADAVMAAVQAQRAGASPAQAAAFARNEATLAGLRGGDGGGGYFAGQLGSMARFAGRAVVAGTAFSAIYGTQRAVRSGFSSLLDRQEDFRQAELGAGGAILTQGRYYGAGGAQLPISQQFAIARRQGGGVLNQLLRDSANTGLDFDAARSGYSASAGFLNAATQDPEKQAKLLEGLVVVSDRLGISQGQVKRTIDNIIKGMNVQRTELGSALGLTSKQVQQWRESGQLVERLTEHLAGFSESAKENLTTWTGIKNSIDASMTLLARETGGGFYKEILGIGEDFRRTLKQLQDDPVALRQIEDGFQNIGKIIRGTTYYLTQFIMEVGKLASTQPTRGGISMFDSHVEPTPAQAMVSSAGWASVMAHQKRQSARGTKWRPGEVEAVAGTYRTNPGEPSGAGGGSGRARRQPDLGAYPYKAYDRLYGEYMADQGRAADYRIRASEDRADFALALYDAEYSGGRSIASERSRLLGRYPLENAALMERVATDRDRRASASTEGDVKEAQFNLARSESAVELAAVRLNTALRELDNRLGNLETTARDLGGTLVDAFFSGGDFRGALKGFANNQLRSYANEGVSRIFDTSFAGGQGSQGGGGGFTNLLSKAQSYFSAGTAAGSTGAASTAAGLSASTTPPMTSAAGGGLMSAGAPAASGAGGAGAAGAGAAGGIAAAAIMIAIGTEAAIKRGNQLVSDGGLSQSQVRKKSARAAFEANGLPSFLGDIAASPAGWVFDPAGAILAHTATPQIKTEGAFTRKNLAGLLDDLGIPRVGVPIGASPFPTRNLPGLGEVDLNPYKKKGSGWVGSVIGGVVGGIFGGPFAHVGGAIHGSNIQRSSDARTRYAMDFARGLSFRDFGAYGNSLDDLASLSGVYLNINPKTGAPRDLGKGPQGPVEDTARAILNNAALLGLSREDALSMVRKVNQGAAGGFDEGLNKLLAVRSRGLQRLASGSGLNQRYRPASGGAGADSPTVDRSLERRDLDRQFSGSVVSLLDSFQSLYEGINKTRLALEVLDKDGVAHVERLKRAAEDVTAVFSEGIPNALEEAIRGEDFAAPGRALADAIFGTFKSRLSERLLQEGVIGEFLTDAAAEASSAAEAFARGDYAGGQAHAAAAAAAFNNGQGIANQTLGAIGSYARNFGSSIGVNGGTGIVVGSPVASLPTMPRRASMPMMAGGGGGVVMADPALTQAAQQQVALLAAIAKNGGRAPILQIGQQQFELAVVNANSNAATMQRAGSYVPNANLGA